MRKAAIGVDIGGTSVKLGLVDEKGKIVLRDSFLTSRVTGRAAFIEHLVSHIGALRKEARYQKLKVTGVGIGAPGPIDVERGFVYFFPNIPGWKNTPFKKILEKKLKCPVFVDNDANAMALGEFRFGAGRGSKNMIALTLGTGLGGGMVMEGRLFHGHKFSAAEMGHVVVDERGPRCGCGNRGCIETFVGNGYLVNEVSRSLKSGRSSILKQWLRQGKTLDPILIEHAAKAGDRLAKEQWQRTGDKLGTFLAGLVNMLNPEVVVLGGGVAKAGDLLFNPVRGAIKKKAFPIASGFVKVVPARLGSDAGLVGAAALAFPVN